MALFATIIDIVLKLFGLRRAKDPSAIELATAAATEQASAAQEQAANEILSSSGAARSDADARVVRVLTDAQSNDRPAAGVNGELHKQFPADFRPGD